MIAVKFSFKSRFIILVTAVVVSALTLTGVAAERYFSSTAFCTKCHSMTFPYQDIKRSVHYGRLGINPECGDCHLPPGFARRMVVHAVDGIRDTISEARHDLSTREYYEVYRDEFKKKAVRAIRGWNSSPCRSCHKTPKPRSESGRASHRAMAAGNATCIDCHQGIFH